MYRFSRLNLMYRWLIIFVIAFSSDVTEGVAQVLTGHLTNAYDVEIFTDGSAIVVPISYKGQTYRFLLDTGSADTLLDSKTFEKALDPILDHKSNSSQKAQTSGLSPNTSDLLVGGTLPIKTNALNRFDLSRHSAVLGETIHGILGCDFLGSYVIDIDADAARLRLVGQKQRCNGRVVELRRDKFGRPIYRAEPTRLPLGSKEAEFLLDTGLIGFIGLSLEKDLFESYIHSGHLTVLGQRLVAQADQNRIERFGTLHGFGVWTNLDEIQAREKAGDQLNLLGLSYLLQFNFTLDLPNSKLYLRPRKAPLNLLQLKDASGFSIWRQKSEISIYRIEPQGPAAKAGLRESDIITSVDGVPAEKLRLHPLRVSFCEEGKIVRLGVRRNSRSLAVDLHLADWRKPATKADFE